MMTQTLFYPEGRAGSAQYPPEPQPAYQVAPPPAAESGTDDKLAQLKQLGELRDAGVLTEAEFEVQKEKILAG
jgi:hypothetical protein